MDTTVHPWRTRLVRWWPAIAAIAVLFPLARLWPLDGQFATDWYNHKWLAGWTGEYMRQHHTVPVVFNTPSQAGMAYPPFYGTLFYPILGLFTAWLSTGFVFRLLAVVVTVLQFRAVSSALARVGIPVWSARAISCLTIWAIYPLTNLYNRSAITEYVATALLTSMVACWFSLVYSKDAAERTRLASAIGILFVLTAGTHPTTALYSLPTIALLLVAAYAVHGRDRAFWIGTAKVLALPIALVIAVLSPWIYALAQYKSYLRVAIDGGPWYYAGLDTWAARFSPIPSDSRVIDGIPLNQVSTPYLDAQMNIALLVLVVGWLAIVLVRDRKIGLSALRAAALGLLACGFFLWLSLYPSAFELLPSAARMLQIAYRAITYQNLALLLVVFMVAEALRRRDAVRLLEKSRAATGVLIASVALSAIGVVIMWTHTTAIMHREGPTWLRTTLSQRRLLPPLPPTFYGVDAYATPSLYSAMNAFDISRLRQVQIPIGTDKDFGEPLPLQISCPIDTWLDTNVHAFPWNHFYVDGVRVPDSDLRANVIKFVVPVGPGEHTVVMRTEPPTVWLVLRDGAFAVLAAWFAWFCSLAIRARLARRASAPPSAS